jgi:hypothetical protein
MKIAAIFRPASGENSSERAPATQRAGPKESAKPGRVLTLMRAGGRAGDSIAPPDRTSSRQVARCLASESSPGSAPVRQNRGMRVERSRENLFTVTATGQELSALVAGARLALDAMRASPDAPATAIELLGRVLDDFDRSRKRLSEPPPDGDRH